MPACWTREATSLLISQWQLNTELTSKSKTESSRLKRINAGKKIAEELNKLGFCKYSMEDIFRKMHGLKTQYQRQWKLVDQSERSGGEVYVPKLWTYPLLGFLSNSNMASYRYENKMRNLASTSNSSSFDTPDPLKVEPLEMTTERQTEEENTYEHNYKDNDEEIDEEQEEINIEVTPNFHTSVNPNAQANINHFFMKSAMELSRPLTPPSATREELTNAFLRLIASEMLQIKNPKNIRKVKNEILNVIYAAQQAEDEN